MNTNVKTSSSDDLSYATKGLEGLYKEHNFKISKIDIKGEIPKEIYGALYKNGPGSNDVFGDKNGHWFDGYGMICAFFLGKVKLFLKILM